MTVQEQSWNNLTLMRAALGLTLRPWQKAILSNGS